MYKTNLVDGKRVLKKKKGNCIYLGPKGCKIYNKQPYMCRVFDCRLYALDVSKMSFLQQQERSHIQSIPEGIDRLKKLNIEITLKKDNKCPEN